MVSVTVRIANAMCKWYCNAVSCTRCKPVLRRNYAKTPLWVSLKGKRTTWESRPGWAAVSRAWLLCSRWCWANNDRMGYLVAIESPKNLNVTGSDKPGLLLVFVFDLTRSCEVIMLIRCMPILLNMSSGWFELKCMKKQTIFIFCAPRPTKFWTVKALLYQAVMLTKVMGERTHNSVPGHFGAKTFRH